MTHIKAARTWLVLLVATVACGLTAHAQIEVLAVTSGASFTQGIPHVGSIASVFCRGLQLEGIVTAESLPLPRIMAGVRVWVGGAEAPIFAVANLDGFQQINIQVPREARATYVPEWGVSAADIVIEQNGLRGERRWWWGIWPWPPFRSPGEFFRLGGTNLGIFQHAVDYSLVTAEHPARPGETLIAYLTGMETAVPIVPTGEPAPADPLSTVGQSEPNPQCPSCGYSYYYLKFDLDYEQGEKTFDRDRDSKASFIGLTPELVGLNQVNFTLPPTLPAGVKSVTLIRQWSSPMFGTSGLEISTPVLLPVQ